MFRECCWHLSKRGGVSRMHWRQLHLLHRRFIIDSSLYFTLSDWRNGFTCRSPLLQYSSHWGNSSESSSLTFSMCLNILHLLIFQLAKRMIKKFPKLINDIYISEEWVEKEASVESSCRIAHLSFLRYYGENVLHMATTNEDPAMVKYLLDAGVNFQVSTQNILIQKVSTQNTLL